MAIIFLVSFNPASFPQISWVSLPTNSDLLFIITSYLFSSLLMFYNKWNLWIVGCNYMKHYAHHSFEISFHLPLWNQWNMSAWTLWLWEHSIAFSLQKWQYCSVQMNTYFNFRHWKWNQYVDVCLGFFLFLLQYLTLFWRAIKSLHHLQDFFLIGGFILVLL